MFSEMERAIVENDCNVQIRLDDVVGVSGVGDDGMRARSTSGVVRVCIGVARGR